MSRKQLRRIRGLVVTLLLTMSTCAHALRCGSRLIDEGDHVSKLLRYCGNPYLVQPRLTQVALGATIGHTILLGRYEDIVIEEWTYNFGPHKLMPIVRIGNGIVIDIRHIGYGFLPR